ncbi:MCE family protein [Kitasatospora sp. NPDC094015]|uniref:MCE family protein n=1 Tax=Kitasatospora sp. NPDC094015 TaxID=3155205 RepID=UPI003333CD20
MSARGPRRAGRRTAGVVFLLVPALLAGVSVAVYDKDFSNEATVTVETGTVGNELHVNADVKLRGVVVGRVRQVSADGERARLTLAMDPDRLPQIPADVRAQLLPTTLFGERFVALVPTGPATGSAAGPATGPALKAGSTIPQDRSADAIELEQLLDHLLPLLTAVQPEKLAATLDAVSTALRGRGEQLGRTLRQLDDYLGGLNPQLPTLNRDIQQLVTVGRTYADAAPDILQALTDLTTTSSTIAQQQAGLRSLYATGTAGAQQLTDFLRRNSSTLIRLSADSRGTLDLLAEYAPAFPCTLRTLADFVPVMDKALGKGTDRPGLHVDVTTVPSRGAYRPGRDTPVYRAGGGPQCYDAPYTGQGRTPSAAAPGDGFPMPTTPGLGLPNSPQENELVNELLAPGRTTTTPLPDWSSLLAGPLLRGAEVTLK